MEYTYDFYLNICSNKKNKEIQNFLMNIAISIDIVPYVLLFYSAHFGMVQVKILNSIKNLYCF
jgi:hypothetical protein